MHLSVQQPPVGLFPTYNSHCHTVPNICHFHWLTISVLLQLFAWHCNNNCFGKSTPICRWNNWPLRTGSLFSVLQTLSKCRLTTVWFYFVLHYIDTTQVQRTLEWLNSSDYITPLMGCCWVKYWSTDSLLLYIHTQGITALSLTSHR